MMSSYRANLRDVKFILWEQLKIDRLLQCGRYRRLDRETLDLVVDQAALFAEKELAPANAEGDRMGCRFDKGKVLAPPLFHRLLEKFREAGWVTLYSDPEVGGQGLPHVITTVAEECFIGSNFNFFSYAGLMPGVGRLIEVFGTPEQKERYLGKLYSGQWGATMCLTEPQAGSSVGDVKTSARRAGDGFLISGNKVFITSGEHDMTENIVHTVLARIEGAPPGPKGLSLFVVPKYRVRPDGSLGELNDVNCAGIEEKIGQHGTATCALNFGENGGCRGELLGADNQGMACMFQLMNEARVSVGLQGIAQSSAAYLAALAYAKERVQGAHITAAKDPNAPRVEIIKHPDVRRTLLGIKAYVEGMRALLLYACYLIDLAEEDPDPEERARCEHRAQLLTPICKAYCSDMGFRAIESALQVFGGYGVCREYGVEQLLRDCKIASIYEGTNGIQALDLIGRKIGMKNGQVFLDLMQEIENFIREARTEEELTPAIEELDHAREKLAGAVTHLGMLGTSGDPLYPVLQAYPCLMLFGDVLLGWLLLWQARLAMQRLSQIYEEDGAADEASRQRLVASHPEATFYAGKVAAARFFAFNLLPEAHARHRAIMAGDHSALTLPESAF